jgi:hypothetical protein
MTEQYRVIRVPQAVDDLEVELNKHAAEGYEWVEQIMVGHVAAIVLRKSD